MESGPKSATENLGLNKQGWEVGREMALEPHKQFWGASEGNARQPPRGQAGVAVARIPSGRCADSGRLSISVDAAR